MLTDRTFLGLLYNAASEYVPTTELTEEQLEKFDNITYRWCKCRRCQKDLRIRGEVIIPQNVGHCNKKTLEICLSRPFFRKEIEPPLLPRSLLNFIRSFLHEIVHALFPEFDEDQTDNKTDEWLKRNYWMTYEPLV